MAGKISFVGVKTEFEPVPSGAYDCEFVDFKKAIIKSGDNKGAEAANLSFKITEEGDYKNKRLFRFCAMTPDSLWAFKRSMVALGADVEWDDPEGIDWEEICRQVLHRACIVKTTLDPEGFEDQITHEKKPSNRIDDVVPTESMRLSQAEAAQQQVVQPTVVEHPDVVDVNTPTETEVAGARRR